MKLFNRKKEDEVVILNLLDLSKWIETYLNPKVDDDLDLIQKSFELLKVQSEKSRFKNDAKRVQAFIRRFERRPLLNLRSLRRYVQGLKKELRRLVFIKDRHLWKTIRDLKLQVKMLDRKTKPNGPYETYSKLEILLKRLYQYFDPKRQPKEILKIDKDIRKLENKLATISKKLNELGRSKLFKDYISLKIKLDKLNEREYKIYSFLKGELSLIRKKNDPLVKSYMVDPLDSLMRDKSLDIVEKINEQNIKSRFLNKTYLKKVRSDLKKIAKVRVEINDKLKQNKFKQKENKLLDQFKDLEQKIIELNRTKTKLLPKTLNRDFKYMEKLLKKASPKKIVIRDAALVFKI